MKFVMLSIEGLFSYKEKSSLALDNPGLTLVDGEIDNDAGDSNGAGKTSIIDAICLCLFKCTTRGTDGDDVVNDDMNSGWASLTFLSGNEAYQAQYERDRRLRRTTWRIYQVVDGNLINISGKTQSETSQIIEAITGINYKAFSNSVLFGQGSISLFLSRDATDSDRKRLFTQILDLDVLDEALKETREAIATLSKSVTEGQALIDSHNIVIEGEKEAKAEKARVEEELESVNNEIASVNKDLEALKSVEDILLRAKDAETRISDAEKSLSTIASDKERAGRDKAKGLDDCKREEETAKAQLSDIDREEKLLPEIANKLKNISDAESEKAEFDSAISEVQKKMAVINTQIQERKQKISTLEVMKAKVAECKEDDRCPYCAQGLDETSRKNINLKADMEIVDYQDQIEDLKFEKGQAQSEIDTIVGKCKAASDILADKEEKTRLIQRQQKIVAKVEGRVIWNEQLKRLEVKKKEIATHYTSWLEDLEARKKSCEEALDRAKKAKCDSDAELKDAYIPSKSKDTLQGELEYLLKDRDNVNVELGAANQALASIRDSKTAVKVIKEELERLELEMKYEKFLEEMFGPDGIKSLIITSVTPRLTSLANKYLETLSDKQMTIEFVTSYEGKTTVIEDFKILVTRGLRTSDIRSFSGGEKKCIEFAVRFAISDIIREKAGCNIESLFLDEPFDSLDRNKITRSIQLLRSLSEKFPTIYAMCHIPYASDQFDRIVTVKNVGNASRIVDSAA